MISIEKYNEALKIVNDYNQQVINQQLKDYRESDILKNYIKTSEGFTKLSDSIDNLIKTNIDPNTIINATLNVSTHYAISNPESQKYIKKVIKHILDKYTLKNFNFINNRNLDYNKELFKSLLKEEKIRNYINKETILRIRNYIGSNLSTEQQIQYLQIYILLLRKIDKTKLLEIGDRYIDEYQAFKKCFENL